MTSTEVGARGGGGAKRRIPMGGEAHGESALAVLLPQKLEMAAANRWLVLSLSAAEAEAEAAVAWCLCRAWLCESGVARRRSTRVWLCGFGLVLGSTKDEWAVEPALGSAQRYNLLLGLNPGPLHAMDCKNFLGISSSEVP